MDTKIDPKLLNDPLFRELMAEGLAMQDRFAAEPVYAKTGQGFLKSAGVEELKKIKEARKLERRPERSRPCPRRDLGLPISLGRW